MQQMALTGDGQVKAQVREMRYCSGPGKDGEVLNLNSSTKKGKLSQEMSGYISKIWQLIEFREKVLHDFQILGQIEGGVSLTWGTCKWETVLDEKVS